jgi:pimeloyl-ACP methyl ester carboxylesterase
MTQEKPFSEEGHVVGGEMNAGPAPGSLIDVGGYRLHLECGGEGRPPVVFEAAMWDFGLTWSLVRPEVATFTRACAYDRAGKGWSEPSPKPRTGAVMMDELRAALIGAGTAQPYVLVAHSSSGILARMLAHRHRAEVSGMVLVDSAHEEQFLRFPEPIRRAQGPILKQQRAAVLGLRSLIEAGSVDPAAIPAPPQLPPDVAEQYRALTATGKAADTMLAELDTIEQVHAEAREMGISALGTSRWS